MISLKTPQVQVQAQELIELQIQWDPETVTFFLGRSCSPVPPLSLFILFDLGLTCSEIYHNPSLHSARDHLWMQETLLPCPPSRK